jgi:NarL family two-component system response regulator LiaR
MKISWSKKMGKQESIRVLSVDDHELMRRGIRFSLLSVEDIDLVAEAHSGEEAISQCEEVRPDVVLMDMYLTGSMDGIAATRAIREHFPQVQVLALSSFFEKDLVQGAMQAGAIGYLVKGVSGAELADAIRAAYAGRPTLTGEAVEALVQSGAPSPQLGHDLTEREREVLALLVEGLSNAAIADRLYLSVAAIKYHVSNILSKLGATNRTEAAILALEYDLVPKRK